MDRLKNFAISTFVSFSVSTIFIFINLVQQEWKLFFSIAVVLAVLVGFIAVFIKQKYLWNYIVLAAVSAFLVLYLMLASY